MLVQQCLLIVCSMLFLAPEGRQALLLRDNRPGALPFLHTQVNNLPGGKFIYDLKNPRKVDNLGHLADFALDVLQEGSTEHGVGAKGGVLFRRGEIVEATEQTVAGRIVDLIFFVDAVLCIRPLGAPESSVHGCMVDPQGPRGRCWLKIFLPPNNTCIDIKTAECVKLT